MLRQNNVNQDKVDNILTKVATLWITFNLKSSLSVLSQFLDKSIKLFYLPTLGYLLWIEKARYFFVYYESIKRELKIFTSRFLSSGKLKKQKYRRTQFFCFAVSWSWKGAEERNKRI
jgi:hypothetical protein